jgi:hypothetical protein
LSLVPSLGLPFQPLPLPWELTLSQKLPSHKGSRSFVEWIAPKVGAE